VLLLLLLLLLQPLLVGWRQRLDPKQSRTDTGGTWLGWMGWYGGGMGEDIAGYVQAIKLHYIQPKATTGGRGCTEPILG
jgi:hypothetical protein